MTDIILHLSAGQGPHECGWVVEQLTHALCREAHADGLSCEPIEPVSAPCPSTMVRISGADSEAFVAARAGTIRWIGTSPFRPLHKRRNWFVGIQRISETRDIPEFHDSDIRYQTLRASGPGGQHVNKTDSAVRATHLPTGLTTLSQDQRSQFANKRIARLKLTLLFEHRHAGDVADSRHGLWQQNQAVERGNAARTYEGLTFRLVRTGS